MLFRLIVIPITLFSGTFFPVEQLPAVVRPLGVDLAAVARHRAGAGPRRWTGGRLLPALGHLAFLVRAAGVRRGAVRPAFTRRLAQ